MTQKLTKQQVECLGRAIKHGFIRLAHDQDTSINNDAFVHNRTVMPLVKKKYLTFGEHFQTFILTVAGKARIDAYNKRKRKSDNNSDGSVRPEQEGSGSTAKKTKVEKCNKK